VKEFLELTFQIQWLSTNECTVFINIFHFIWLLHVSAIRHLQGAHKHVGTKINQQNAQINSGLIYY